VGFLAGEATQGELQGEFNIDGRVYVCIWLGLVLGSVLVLGFGLGLGFAMICSGHGHLC